MFPKMFSSSADPSSVDSPPSPQAALEPSADPAELSVKAGDAVAVTASPTKMAQATEIYRRMTRKKGIARKEIVAAFIEEVGLTKSGAATYYQMIKKGRR